MYNIAYINNQHIVAECCLIYCTNLSISWHHSLQGVCCSSFSAGSDTIPRREVHLSVSGLAGGTGWRDVAQRVLIEFKVKIRVGINFNWVA